METKHPDDTLVIMNELVLPNDTNTLGNLMGGRLLHWMDICAAMSAQKHSASVCVTAAVNNVSFEHPIKLGHVVTLRSRCVRAFKTSVEVHIEVWSQDLSKGGEALKSNDAFYTFVAIDGNGRTVSVPSIEPTTPHEKRHWDYSLLRRQLKLLVAHKITLNDAPELKEQFEQWLKGAEAQLS